jgi:hypothetical protein
MATRSNSSPSNNRKLQIVGFLLMGLSLLGIIPLTVNYLLTTLLGDPSEGTTKLAIVNLGTLLSVVFGFIAGLGMVLVGITRKAK